MEKRKSKKQRGSRPNRKRNGSRRRPLPGITRVNKTDKYGGNYGGSIAAMSTVESSMDFSPHPKGPLKEANYSTAQLVGTFAGGAGSAFSNGSAGASPFVSALANANGYFVIPFEMTDVDQSASFAGVFDQYRIDKIEVKITPEMNALNDVNVASPNATNPMIYVALDFDDANTPTSLAYIRQYDNVQSAVYADGGFFITILPSFTPALWSGGAFTAYAVERAGWIDASNLSVPHFGLKGCITALTAGSTQQVNWYLTAKYFMSFRNTH